jgi:hypothetical protein
MEHGFALDTGEAHLMFLATRETVLAAGGGIGGGVATRSALAGLPSFRSREPRADARFGPPWLGCPHSALEQTVLRGLD